MKLLSHELEGKKYFRGHAICRKCSVTTLFEHLDISSNLIVHNCQTQFHLLKVGSFRGLRERKRANYLVFDTEHRQPNPSPDYEAFILRAGA